MANKIEIVDKTKNIAFVKLEKHVNLELSDIEFNGYIRYGKDNNYPKFLIDLYKQDADHGAIINAKSAYLWGKGLKAKNPEQEQIAKSFLAQMNPAENSNQFGKKISKDDELFNGFYTIVITNLMGDPLWFYHLPYAECRLSLEGDVLSHSNDWDNIYRNPIRYYKLYQPGCKGSFFIPFKHYTPSHNKIGSLYSEPSYKSCIMDISADTEITNFNYNFIANGFSAGTIVTFYNGEPTPEIKAKIKEKIVDKFTGSDNAGAVVINYVDENGKAAEVTAIDVADLDKKFDSISKRVLQKKITGHNVTDPQLFGINKEGAMFSTRGQLRDAFELFLNNYTKPRQEELAEYFSTLCYLKTKQYVEFEFIQNDPMGMDLSTNQDLTQDERREIIGYEPLTPVKPTVDAMGNPLPIEQEVNSTLTNLTGRQFQGLMRIVSKYDAGKINEFAAVTMMVQGFGLSKEDALKFLKENDNQPEKIQQQFEAQEKRDAILFELEQSAQDSDEEDEVIFEQEVNFKNSTDALKFELNAHKMYFADPLSISVTELKNGILQALKGNPTQTPSGIAKALGVIVDKVNTGIEGLLGKNLISPNANGFDPTDKAYDKETEPLKISTVYTVYKYALKSDAPDLVSGGSSRPFCKSLMNQSNAGKVWTFEAIDKMSNKLGLNVWDFRGGYYNNPETGETEPYCRHIWKAVTKIKRGK